MSKRAHVSNRCTKLVAVTAIVGMFALASPARADGPPNGSVFAGVFGDGAAGVGTDAAMGTARASYPIAIPPARGAQQPILSLSYAHTSHAISEVGAAWSLGLPVIERHAAAGGPPTFTSSDVFQLSGARLVLLCTVAGTSCATGNGTFPTPYWSTGWKVYRPEIDSSYTRAFLSANGLTWRIQKRSGEILELGGPLMVAGATYEAAGGYDFDASSGNVFRFKLVRQFEAFTSGTSPKNLILYSWRHWSTGDISTLEDIYYTAPAQAAPDNPDAYAHHIHLRYQDNSWHGPRFVSVPPWLNAPDRLVQSIEISSKGLQALREQVRRYALTYTVIAGRPYIANVTMEGRCPTAPVSETFYSDGRRDTWMLPAASSCPRALPGTSYTYSYGGSLDENGGYLGARAPVKIHFDTPAPSLSLKTLALVDVNRDGLADFIQSDQAHVFINGGRGGEPVAREFHASDLNFNFVAGSGKFDRGGLSIVGGWGGTWGMTWAHRDPSPSQTQANGGPHQLYQLMGPSAGFGPGYTMYTFGNGVPDNMPPPHVFGDLDGDGSTDALLLDETQFNTPTKARLSTRTLGDPTWGGIVVPFPLSNLQNSNLRLRTGTHSPRSAALADFDGDGIADYVTERDPWSDDTLVFIPGRGRGQFGCVGGSGCVPSIGSPGYNASVPATSLSEVQISGGGFFGYEPLTITKGPVRLQDLTGDGKAEIVQLYRDPADTGWVADVWINADGTGAMHLDSNAFPDGDFNLSGAQEAGGPPYMPSLFFGDIDGDGINDLVICGDNECVYRSYSPFQPPGLLTQIDHESGATTAIATTPHWPRWSSGSRTIRRRTPGRAMGRGRVTRRLPYGPSRACKPKTTRPPRTA